MRKRILSFCLLFSLLFGNSVVNAKGETTNNTNVKKNIRIEKVLNHKNFYVENGVKTYFVLFSDVIKELENNSINYHEIFTKEEIKVLKNLDKINLNKRNETSMYRYRINSKYSRTEISSTVGKQLIGYAIGEAIPGIGNIGKFLIGMAIDNVISKYDKPVIIYIHNFNASEGSNYSAITVEEQYFSGWSKGKVLKQIDRDYGVNPYDLIVREPWYYIESDFAYVPEGSSGWKKINGKWYEFAEYGDLIEHSGWREYNDKWMYHIPGDYGAYADEWKEIDSEWFRFDDDGYCVEGRGCN